jgi:hypothetical protein
VAFPNVPLRSFLRQERQTIRTSVFITAALVAACWLALYGVVVAGLALPVARL